MSIATELDKIQERLHDNGVLWPRAELLRWLNDGYSYLISQSEAVKRWFIFDLPPRTAWTTTHDWEKAHAKATFRKLTKTALGGNAQCTAEWEVESSEDATPTNSNPAVTQLWEMELVAPIDDHFRFFLPKSHERMVRVAFNDKRMWGISDKELDLRDARWWNQAGMPEWWLRGLDRDKSFEAYQIQTTYSQNYLIAEDTLGCVRQLRGERSYINTPLPPINDFAYTSGGDVNMLTGFGWRTTMQSFDVDYDVINCTYQWEKNFFDTEYGFGVYGDVQYGGAFPDVPSDPIGVFEWETLYGAMEHSSFGFGLLRSITSPARQYLPMAYDTGEQPLLGTVRDFKSSNNSVSVLETIIDTRDLTEDDSPALIPPRMYKYLRFYVWSIAFGRQGEAQNLALATHYKARFDVGVELLKLLGDLANMDRNYSRSLDPVLARSRPPTPRLPWNYPRAGY